MDINSLPARFVSFEELVICTNTLVNGQVPIEVQGKIPFLVGKGEIPRVWLSVPSPDGSWTTIVAENKRVDQERPTFKQYLLTIEESSGDKRIDVTLWKTTILSVKKETDTKAVVTHLDLRPFSLLIFGDQRGLNIGEQMLRNNTISNVQTMIGIG